MYFFFSTDCCIVKEGFSEFRGQSDNNQSVFDGVNMIKIDPYSEFQKLLTASYKILDEKFNVISAQSYIIKYEEKYTKNALKLIDTFDKVNELDFKYVYFSEIKDVLIKEIKNCKYFISHYSDHHLRLLYNELDTDDANKIQILFDIDILRKSMPFTEIRMHKTGKRLKIPSLKEVYQWLNNKPIKISNSYDNIKALTNCFKQLNERGLINELHPNIEFVDELIKSKLKTYIDLKQQKN